MESRSRKCRRCGTRFVICRSCYRGHRYCSSECSCASRVESVRSARRRYRASPEGREDHRDRERERRKRRRVGDHSRENLRTETQAAPCPREVSHARTSNESQTSTAPRWRLHSIHGVRQVSRRGRNPGASKPALCLVPPSSRSGGGCVVCGRLLDLGSDVAQEVGPHSPRARLDSSRGGTKTTD